MQIVALIITAVIFLSPLSADQNREGANGCTIIQHFISEISGKDFLHYELKKKLLPFFRGTSKEKENNYYTFIVRMAWKWRKLNISSSIVKRIKLLACKKRPDGNFEGIVEVYFHHFLFFTKSFQIKLIAVNSDEGWKITLPSFSDEPLK